MELQVSGKLKTGSAEHPSFKGFRIEALFDGKPALTPSPPSTSRAITAEHLDDARAKFTESHLDSAPDLIAAATAAEAPSPFLVSALSDDAGNFTLVFPDQQEIASKTVKFTVLSPARRIIREMEVMTADLGKPITIELEALGPEPPDEPVPEVNTPQRLAVHALFRTDAALRRAITENLKSLRVESEAVAARVKGAWKLNPSQLTDEERARRHYVAPGADPGEVQETVIMSGVDALRSANIKGALTLRNSTELKKLIKEAEPADSLHGVVELGPLIEFIQRRGAGPFLGAELTSTPYRAEAEAEAILDAVGNGDRGGDGDVAARREALSSDARETDELVKNTVNMQMMSATAPEAQLAYSKIPNSADEDKAQKTILQSFDELREGPTDVTSYHDFHTLQIAFAHVWTEIFDGQLELLGRDLYSEYVKLKDFSGSTQPDLRVSTIADLKRLIEEIKKLSQFMQEEIPSSLRPEGGGQKTNDWTPVTPEDAARLGGMVATGGVSLFIEWAFNELIKLGNKPVIATWKDFPLKLNEGRGNIIELLPPEQNCVYPGNVEIVLETDSNSFKKQMVFQQWDSDLQRPIYNAEVQNFGSGHGSERGPSGTIIDRLLLNTSQIAFGTFKFVSEDEIVNQLLLGRYVLGDLTEVLKDRTRVTFRWKGQR